MSTVIEELLAEADNRGTTAAPAATVRDER